MIQSRPFTPPPDAERCCAATWCGYYNARCPFRRVEGSDVCREHLAQLALGLTVKRVRRPAEVGR